MYTPTIDKRRPLPVRDDPAAPLHRWWAALGDIPQGNDLPLDRPRPARNSEVHRSAVVTELAADLAGRLRSRSRACGVPFETLLFTGVGLLIQRLTANDVFALGTTMSPPETRRSNVVAVPLGPAAEGTLDAAVRHVNDRLVTAYAHARVPFAEVVSAVGEARDDRRHPIFDIMVLFDRDEDADALPAAVAPAAGPPVDIVFRFTDATPRPCLRAEYRGDVFDELTVRRWLDRLIVVFDQLAGDGEVRVDELRVLPAEEQELVTGRWNATTVAYPHTATLWDLFTEQAHRTPDAMALVSEKDGARLSYRRLRDRADKVARGLASRGVGPGSLVGVCHARGSDLIVSMLGILGAGAAYVPLDPDDPLDRLGYKVDDAGLSLIVAEQDEPPRLAKLGVPVVTADALRAGTASGAVVSPARADDLAYVMYTSGSTGRPKGVMIEHRAIVNSTRWMIRELGFTPRDRVLQKTPCTFDVSVCEIFAPLLSGATLVMLPPEHHRDPELLLDCVANARITYMNFVPSTLSALLGYDDVETRTRGVRMIGCIGEALPPAVARTTLDRIGCRLMNLYGPTEASVQVSIHEVTAESLESGAGTVPIGRPIDNTSLHVVDAAGRVQPIGVEGDLLIGGVGLARGYVNAPELTASRFFRDHLTGAPDSRLYHSGDRARWNSSGELEFLGRGDNQVKLRGLRIELEEIERTIVQLGLAAGAVVAVRGETESAFLVAYLVTGSERIDMAAFSTRLGEKLPTYMIPRVVMEIDALPVSPNGKLDRDALPSLEA